MISWLGALLGKLPVLGTLLEKLTTSSKVEELKAQTDLEEAKALSKKGWVSPSQLAKYCIVILTVAYALLYMIDCIWDFADLPSFSDVLDVIGNAMKVLGG